MMNLPFVRRDRLEVAEARLRDLKEHYDQLQLRYDALVAADRPNEATEDQVAKHTLPHRPFISEIRAAAEAMARARHKAN